MRSILLIISCVAMSCAVNYGDDVVVKELISSKGEKIYVLSVNYGVTGDYQLSSITKNKDKDLDDNDSVSNVDGFHPFEYKFQNDTLTLYFRNKIRYRVAETFKTIVVQYKVMDGNYYKLRDSTFHSVPDIEPKTVPGMPKPPTHR